jgi:hypothetical protein
MVSIHEFPVLWSIYDSSAYPEVVSFLNAGCGICWDIEYRSDRGFSDGIAVGRGVLQMEEMGEEIRMDFQTSYPAKIVSMLYMLEAESSE